MSIEHASVGTIVVCIKKIIFGDLTVHEVGQRIRIDHVNKYYFALDENRINYVTLSDYILYHKNKEE